MTFAKAIQKKEVKKMKEEKEMMNELGSRKDK